MPGLSDSQINPPIATKKSNKTLWIVLGSLGGVMLVLFGICCGGLLWFSTFPSVPATASQPLDNASIPLPPLPEPGPAAMIAPGVMRSEVVWGNGTGIGQPPGADSRLWVYLPASATEPGSLPCVLITAAGSTMLEGMDLGAGDQPEHLPYVQAGFAVVAFELDGASGDGDEVQRYTAFRAANAGLVNARNALEYTLSKVPQVNPRQIFSAGHSSAASLALLFAEHEPRLAGCVAYAPCIDLKARMPAVLVRGMGSAMPHLAEFIVQSSPRTHEQRLSCPVMIFHAADDTNVPVATSREFVQRMQAAGKDVTLKEVPSGEHYDSMIEQGIPAGIAWMKEHLRK